MLAKGNKLYSLTEGEGEGWVRQVLGQVLGEG